LWSADLANLAADMRRVEPYSERFHLDVADGHYVPTMLFFPDLVKALRPYTKLPFEIHLMTIDPAAWIDPFLEAGADGFIFCLDSAKNPGDLLKAIKARGKYTGVSLLLCEPLGLLEPYWNDLDIVTIVGTEMGIKGASMDASVPGKIKQARETIGTFAEKIALPEKFVALKPILASHAQAASLPLVGLTTLQGFGRVGARAGQRILIHAGSGGVGLTNLRARLKRLYGAGGELTLASAAGGGTRNYFPRRELLTPSSLFD
jgi:ribulose-phosphate 3-epimerase